MAELEKPQHPLEVLPAMLNLMLVQTGKFFRDAASREPKDLVAARNLLKQVGESANNRFHEALDEIEIEITRAKAVFERDMRKVRAKRAEREKAAGILTRPAGVVKNRSPSAETKQSPKATDAKGIEETAKASEAVTDVPGQTGEQMMVNGNEAADTTQLGKVEPPATALSAPTQNSLKKDEMAALHNDTTQTENPTIASSTKAQGTNPEESALRPSSPKKTQPDAIPAPTNEEKPASEEPSTNPEAAPFESMFDLEQPEFDLDLSNGQDLLNDSLFEDLGAPSNNENPDLNANATSTEDINTLLPGLENYVNDNGDFSMIDLPVGGTMAQDAAMPNGTTTAAEAQGTTTAAAEATVATDGMTATQALEMPMESNFDDLFGSGEWGDSGEMGDGAMVDFDEDWFKTDG